jgi:hypothetical protein
MLGSTPLIAALLASLVAFVASHWWFGVHRRRLAETMAGIQALAGMKWRDCAGLVLQALGEKGYVEAPLSRQPGDGGTEFLLAKGDTRTLLSYKHGTAYRLGESNVREFANAVRLQGGQAGILVTLGSADPTAHEAAARFGVEILDGRSLWPQVEPFAPSAMVEQIRTEAANQSRQGQRMGVLASLVLGAAVYLAGLGLAAPGVQPAPPVPAPAAPSALAVAADQASLQANDAKKALEEIASLTDEQRLQRRLAAAARVAKLPAADGALWSSQSTLSISLLRADGIDSGIVNEACAILIQYEELRYSRLQLEPPKNATAPVRWRQCQ